MADVQPKVGDIVKLKQRYGNNTAVGLVINVEKSEMTGDGGWTTFSYTILAPDGSITYISDASIESILNDS